MEVSRCCKKNVFVSGSGEGTYYYVCSHCEYACDTVQAQGDSHYGLSCEKPIERTFD